MINESNKILLINKYLRYKKLLDKCEFYESKLSDRELFISVYKTINSRRGIYRILDELKVNSNFYLELYKSNPDDIEYKNIYKISRNLLLQFNEYNLQINR